MCIAQKGTDGTGSGDVFGPATNTDSYIPQWNSANSKTLKDGLAVPAGGLAGITALNTKQTVLTPISTKTSAYSANVGELIPVDLSSDVSFNIQLPTTPADKSLIEITVVTPGITGTLGIVCGGSDVFSKVGGTNTIYLGLKTETVLLQYQSSIGVWFINPTAASENYAIGFPGVDAQTPITNANDRDTTP